MARTRLKFKRSKIKTFTKTTKKYNRIWLSLFLLLGLTVGNFIWDCYKRQDDIETIYGIGKQYYGIIVEEADKAVGHIKNQIDTQDDKREE